MDGQDGRQQPRRHQCIAPPRDERRQRIGRGHADLHEAEQQPRRAQKEDRRQPQDRVRGLEAATVVQEQLLHQVGQGHEGEAAALLAVKEQIPLPDEHGQVGQGQPGQRRAVAAPVAATLGPGQPKPEHVQRDQHDHEQVGIDGQRHRHQVAEPRPPAASADAAQPEPRGQQRQRGHQRVHFALLPVPKLIGVGDVEEHGQQRSVAHRQRPPARGPSRRRCDHGQDGVLLSRGGHGPCGHGACGNQPSRHLPQQRHGQRGEPDRGQAQRDLRRPHQAEPGAQTQEIEHAVLPRLHEHGQRLGQIAYGEDDRVHLVAPETLRVQAIEAPRVGEQDQAEQNGPQRAAIGVRLLHGTRSGQG